MTVATTRALPGFEDIPRSWDPGLDELVATIRLGDYYVTAGQETIGTLLGSCVAACVWDPTTGLGGMNHFLVPDSGLARDPSPGHLHPGQYGIYAMEFLISRIVAAGGSRAHLRAKLVGGGRMIRQRVDVGSRNIQFARAYLDDEGVEVVSEHVGGEFARRVLFEPHTGRCRVRRVGQVERAENEALVRREEKWAEELAQARPVGSIELF